MSPYGEEQKADRLASELDEMYGHIANTSINSEPAKILEELDICNAFFSRVSEIVPVAGAILARAEGEFAEKYESELNGDKPNATLFNKRLAAAVADERKLVMYVDRLDATLDKRIKSLISTLSYSKEIFRGNNHSGGR